MDIKSIEKILRNNGLSLDFIIEESFLGYKERKLRGTLYNSDLNLPKKLITLYYFFNPSNISFDSMKQNFIKKYIVNESKIEEVSEHSKEEIAGLKVMYDYIHSDDINYMFDVYTLKDLRCKLYSFTPFPEYAGDFRNYDVYLPGTGTELSEWSDIRRRLNEVDKNIQLIVEKAKIVSNNKDSDLLFSYIEDCVKINCDLIKIHPFTDGNGRTVRGFINKLFEDAGLPPVYINSNEKSEYHKAMNKANNDGNYSDIYNFYLYKICDSIIELDINGRVKEEKENRKLRKERK